MNVKNHWFWIASITALILDRVTKNWVVENFELRESWPIIPEVFHFTYTTNPGAAFGIFPGQVWLPWLSFIVSAGLMALAVWGPNFQRLEQVGYGCVLGGALGNGLDRFFFGPGVIDFLHFKLINFPIFNIADVAINIGIICLLIASFFNTQGKDKHDP